MTPIAFFRSSVTARTIFLGLAWLAAIGGLWAFAESEIVDANLSAMVAKVGWGTAIGVLSLSLINYAARSWRWIKLAHWNGTPLPPTLGVVLYVAGFAYTLVPAKVGDLMRLVHMRTLSAYPLRRTLGLAVADRVSDMIAALCILVACAASWPFWDLSQWFGVAASIVVVVGALTLARSEAAIGWTAKRIPSLRRTAVGSRRLVKSLRRVVTPTTMALSLPLAAAGWLSEGIAFHWILSTLDASIDIRVSIFIFVSGLVLGAVSMLPGGIGGTEISQTLMLQLVGVDLTTAALSVAISRITTLWFAVALGALASTWLFRPRTTPHERP